MTAKINESLIAAREGAAFIWVSQPGYLRLSGEDRQAFLQRQTTNEINLLQFERSLATVLTSPTGRIHDVLYLFHEPDSIGILTLPGRGQGTFRYLRSRIFFMDKVSMIDVSPEFSQVLIFGEKSHEALARFGCTKPPSADQIIHLPYRDIELLVWGICRELGFGVSLLAPEPLKETITAELLAVGCSNLSDSDYQILRVENGKPGVDSELSEQFTPLEVGLSGLVASQKGCYTGQEVLARQVNYEKITQRLVGLVHPNHASAGDKLSSTDGRPAGIVTSIANSPFFGHISLAVVKRPFDQPDTELNLGNPKNRLQTARVVPLPF